MAPLRLLIVSALSAALLSPAAGAATGSCLPGRGGDRCHVWTGTVGPVDDGDTINVDIAGDPTSRRYKVRLTGVQAMELHSYSRTRGRSGECHAVAATRLLERAIRRGRSRVRLSAIRPHSTTGSRHRLRRSVAFRRGGRWVDAGAFLLRRGLALWLPNGREWAPNRLYSRLAARAARRGRGLWDTAACGGGPAPGVALAMRIQWDANGTDSRNVNGEWARITNLGVSPLPLRGWWFRDSHLRRFRFPAWAAIPAHGSIWVLAGPGASSGDRFYWGQSEPVFENTTGGARAMGDGAYLFDPDGDLRSWVQYPCRVGCFEPLAGRLSVTARARSPEYVTIRNISDAPVSLADYELESSPWFYLFGSDAVLQPGRALVLWIDRRPSFTRRFFFRSVSVVEQWGIDAYLLGDRGDRVTVRNPLGAPVVCAAWGGEACPSV